ncbi:MAG: hypothetical protein PHN69_07980 [Candidatus Pacebacteria bacterium]|nr:hypothetical protein [Candidatus Paceibacterota bacterium]
MDSAVKDYRQKHKRCKFCKWLKSNYDDYDGTFMYSECILKDKVVNHYNISRWYCKYYEVDE